MTAKIKPIKTTTKKQVSFDDTVEIHAIPHDTTGLNKEELFYSPQNIQQFQDERFEEQARARCGSNSPRKKSSADSSSRKRSDSDGSGCRHDAKRERLEQHAVLLRLVVVDVLRAVMMMMMTSLTRDMATTVAVEPPHRPRAVAAVRRKM